MTKPASGTQDHPLQILREIVEDLPRANRGEILRQFRHEISVDPALFEQVAHEVFEGLYPGK